MDQIGTGSMAVLGISQLLYLVVMLTLGVRLMLLAVRTRQLPESLLAMHFLLCCGVGYLLLVTGLSLVREEGVVAPGVIAALLAVGQLCSCVGVFCGICFNFLVFRRKALWAKLLVGLAAIALTAGYVGYAIEGGFSHGRFEGAWFWLYYGTYIAGALWVTIEPLAYYRTMRKRLRLGIAEPLVANRFLLWGVGSVCRFLMVTGGAVPSALMTRGGTELAPGLIGASLVGVALVGLGVVAAYWLTFFPTPGYRRFIERRRPAPAR